MEGASMPDPNGAISRPRYVLCPGWITSRNDGDRHYISAAKLAKCYDVNLRDCLIQLPKQKLYPEFYTGMVFLEPRLDGDYRLPPLPNA
jgi:hypothetical protein